MHFQSSMVAIFGLVSFATAHMKMGTPKPFGESTLNNSPLVADGSDFPCKLRGSSTFDAEGASNPMAVGSSQPLDFVGGATHGGGSCQISITYDNPPTAKSVFKVIHSIEGGCPAKGAVGNIGSDAGAADPSTYSFTVPDAVKNGDAVLAWTWFNKIGNREMYMNCAPVTISGGASDLTAFDKLPDMFVANIGNGCGTPDSTDLLFPNPGDSVEQLGLATSAALARPTGTCQAASGGSGSSGNSAASPSAAAVASTTPVAVSPGVFATVAPSPTTAAAAAPTTSPEAASTPTTSAAPAADPSPAAAPSSSPAVVPQTTSGALSGACSPEGQWNCLGGTSWQRCASGAWSVVMPLAAGTACSPGVSANIAMVAPAKRSVRFSNAHLHRHLGRGKN